MGVDFTQRGLEKLRAEEKTRTYSDPNTPGLCLRITPANSRAWFFVYRMGGRASKKKWLRMGEFASLPLNRAQGKARAYHVQVEDGIDPAKAIADASVLGMTIDALADRFELEYIHKKSQATQDSYKVSLGKYIRPKLGGIEVAALTQEQVSSWHSAITYPIAANRALGALSVMMSLAIRRWKLRETANPCLDIERNPETPRLRDITMDELERIGDAMRKLKGQHNQFVLAAIHTTLLCWGRVSEVVALRRDKDTYLDQGYAIIREHKTKNKMGDKRLELPPKAVEILRSLPEVEGNRYYFPGGIKGKHLTRGGLFSTWKAIREEAKIEDIHIHDTRSLAASEAEAQGINPKTGAALLGHNDPRTTMKHYARVRKTQEAAAKVSAPIARALEGTRKPE